MNKFDDTYVAVAKALRVVGLEQIGNIRNKCNDG